MSETVINPSDCIAPTVGLEMPLLKGLGTLATAHKLYEQRQSLMDSVVPLDYSNIYNNLNVLMAVQAMQQLSSAAYKEHYFSNVLKKGDVSAVPEVKKPVKSAPKAEELPRRERAVSLQKRREKKAKEHKFKRRAKSEKKSWTRDEIVLLLQAAKLLLHRDLKTITKAIYACIDRKPGKCWGRGAEKKLKRILCFQNWRTADKHQVSKLINKRLKEYDAEVIPHNSKIYLVAKSLALK